MHAIKASDNKATKSEKISENGKGSPEPPNIQAEFNPVWHSMATSIGGRAAAGISGEPPPIQTKSLHSIYIQRVCAGCEEELAQGPAGVQNKLTVGNPNDEYEKEADRVADKVMRQPDLSAVNTQEEDQAALLQPKSLNGYRIQRQALEDEAFPENEQPIIQGKSHSHASQEPTDHLNKAVHSPGVGSPLPTNVQKKVEPVLAADLSHVKVHSDATSNKAAKSIQAKAFTHKNNIWLGAGQSSHDVSLMAHEATHVIQQSGVATTGIPAVSKRIIDTPRKKTPPDFLSGKISRIDDSAQHRNKSAAVPIRRTLSSNVIQRAPKPKTLSLDEITMVIAGASIFVSVRAKQTYQVAFDLYRLARAFKKLKARNLLIKTVFSDSRVSVLDIAEIIRYWPSVPQRAGLYNLVPSGRRKQVYTTVPFFVSLARIYASLWDGRIVDDAKLLYRLSRSFRPHRIIREEFLKEVFAQPNMTALRIALLIWYWPNASARVGLYNLVTGPKNAQVSAITGYKATASYFIHRSSSFKSIADAARWLNQLAYPGKYRAPAETNKLLGEIFWSRRITTRRIHDMIMQWPSQWRRTQLFRIAVIARYRTSLTGAWEYRGLGRLFMILRCVPAEHVKWWINSELKRGFKAIKTLGESEGSAGGGWVNIYYRPSAIGKETVGKGYTKPGDPLHGVNLFDENILHEIGHTIDARLRIMSRLGAHTAFGGWRFYPASNHSNAITAMIRTETPVTDGNRLIRVLRFLMMQSKNRSLWAAVGSVEPGAAASKALRKNLVRRYGRLMSVRSVIDCHRAPKDYPSPTCTWPESRIRRYSLGGYFYLETKWPSNGWERYSVDQRRKWKLSDYQWNSRGEWFAEVYAAYYLGKLQTKHPLRSWLDRNVEHNPSLTPPTESAPAPKGPAVRQRCRIP